jgi:lysophospholipase L1-like esterase
MMIRVRCLLLICLSFAFPAAAEPPGASQRVRIVLVGDSTVASRTGWGDAFAGLLVPEAECLNLARGGRSSKSYRTEGHWDKVLEARPNWVLIQFGHNDQPGKGPQRETDAGTTFREKLAAYAKEVREMGGKPVFVTSLTRRNFNSEGRVDPARLADCSDGQGVMNRDCLTSYAEATKAVAGSMGIPCLDLNARSIEQMNQIGPRKALAFDPETRDSSKPDKTHLSRFGAQKTALLVVDEIRKKVPELAYFLKDE